MKKPLIVIAGPTASGKTSLSIELAKRINGEIISADSMQVYLHMDIGTAKVTEQEMQGITHHLVNIIEPNEPFNIQIFQKLAKAAIHQIHAKGKIPIIVGGTGFYIQSVIYDIDFEETHSDPTYRRALEKLSEQKGSDHLHGLLKEVDQVSYDKIHPNNVKRVIRALEFHKYTGKPISEHNEQEMKKTTPYDLLFYVLTMDRNLLYSRIDQRVEQMFEQGLVDELKRLRGMGFTKDLISMQGLGYKEILDYLDGFCSEDEVKYIIKRDTRHFAKRQLTWFRREKDVFWLDIEQYGFNNENILSKVIKDIEVMGIM